MTNYNKRTKRHTLIKKSTSHDGVAKHTEQRETQKQRALKTAAQSTFQFIMNEEV